MEPGELAVYEDMFSLFSKVNVDFINERSSYEYPTAMIVNENNRNEMNIYLLNYNQYTGPAN
jgi:hypothetical protein